MSLLKKAATAAALSLSLASLAHADQTLTINSAGSDQYASSNPGYLELGRVTFEAGTQSISALTTSVTLVDQGWGNQDAGNGVFVDLLSNGNTVYTILVAGANHAWRTQTFDLAGTPQIYTALNSALAGINRAAGPIGLSFRTDAWGYPGWALHTRDDSLSVSTSLQPVPEPETYAMLLLGLGAIALVKRRKA